jgi:cobalt-zinc-cadmium efflux system membrane fusion protein
MLITLAMMGGMPGCGNQQEETSPANPSPIKAPSGLLRLTPEESARMVLDVTPVARGPFRLSREFPATIQANENELAEVTTLTRGRVVKVHVDVGQDVKKGTLLAMLHSTDLGMAEGAYLKAGAKLHEAKLAYERARDLHQYKAVSLAELQQREAEMRTARAEARETETRLELLGVPRQEIERLDREHTIKADVPMRAPFDGRVIMRNITRGEVVETHQKCFTVANLSDMWVIANVPEKDVHFVKKDQAVDVVVAAYPHALLHGRITYISDMLDPATRTMRVRVTVPNPNMRLKPEMFALVQVYAGPASEVLTVPLAAIQNGPAGKIVFVQQAPGEFEVRTVKVGDEQGERVVVLEGLEDGEAIVTKGAFILKSEMEHHKTEPAP